MGGKVRNSLVEAGGHQPRKKTAGDVTEMPSYGLLWPWWGRWNVVQGIEIEGQATKRPDKGCMGLAEELTQAENLTGGVGGVAPGFPPAVPETSHWLWSQQ